MGKPFHLKNGTVLLSIEAPGGLYNATQLKKIAALCDKQLALVKATEDQRIALFAKEDHLPQITGELESVGLGVRHYQSGLHGAVACLGKLCPDHEQDAMGSAMEIAKDLKDLMVNSPLKIGINGCQNCCVPCHTLDVSIVGDAHGYRLSMGGKTSQLPEMASYLAEAIPPNKLSGFVKKIVTLYNNNSQDGESLHEVIDRIGTGEFVKALAPYSQDAADNSDPFGSQETELDAIAEEAGESSGEDSLASDMGDVDLIEADAPSGEELAMDESGIQDESEMEDIMLHEDTQGGDVDIDLKGFAEHENLNNDIPINDDLTGDESMVLAEEPTVDDLGTDDLSSLEAVPEPTFAETEIMDTPVFTDEEVSQDHSELENELDEEALNLEEPVESEELALGEEVSSEDLSLGEEVSSEDLSLGEEVSSEDLALGEEVSSEDLALDDAISQDAFAVEDDATDLEGQMNEAPVAVSPASVVAATSADADELDLEGAPELSEEDQTTLEERLNSEIEEQAEAMASEELDLNEDDRLQAMQALGEAEELDSLEAPATETLDQLEDDELDALSDNELDEIRDISAISESSSNDSPMMDIDVEEEIMPPAVNINREAEITNIREFMRPKNSTELTAPPASKRNSPALMGININENNRLNLQFENGASMEFDCNSLTEGQTRTLKLAGQEFSVSRDENGFRMVSAGVEVFYPLGLVAA